MITFITTPRYFKGIFKNIQTNAISSWLNIIGDKEILLFDVEKPLDEIKKHNNVIIINDIKVNSFGTPLISDLLCKGQHLGKGPIFCFINCDIILPHNFLQTAIICQNKFNKFLMIGHRNDLEFNNEVDFSDSNQENKFWEYAKKNAKKHGSWGIDYFVFTSGVWETIPDFAIGRFMYDNWLIWQARRNRIPVIDASNDIMAIHQNHGYFTKGFSGEKSVREGKEAEENKRLFGNAWNFSIQDSTHEIREGKIRLKNNPNERSWYLYRLRKVYPEWSSIMKIWNKLYRIFI